MAVDIVSDGGENKDGLRSRIRRLFMAMAGNDDLDGTASFRRRRDDVEDVPRATKSNVPPWLLPLIIYLVGQLVGSIWWAATMQSDVKYLQAENLKLWQKIEALDLGREKLDSNLDERIRGKVRETMDDWGYLRVSPRK